MKNEYDIFIPIGGTCKPTYYLRELGLRKNAYPFDWQVMSFDYIIHLFETNFNDFFIQYIDDTENHIVDPGMRYVYDTKNNIGCMHYVSVEDNLEEGTLRFRNLMIKRFNRLKDHINKSKRILILSNYNEIPDKFIEFLKKFEKLFPNKIITLINVISTNDNNFKEYEINNNLKLIQYFFNDETDEEPKWIGNNKEWNKILGNYSVSNDIV